MKRRVLGLSLLVLGAFGCRAAAVPASATPAAVRSVAPSTEAVPALSPYPLRCMVMASNVNYRRGPGTQFASYGQVGRGFAFASSGEIPNLRSRLQYWDNIQRPGHADAYVDDAYVHCWLA